MRSIIVAAFVVAGLAVAGPALASQEAAKKAGCMGCHALDKKKVGPAIKDIAAKYKGQAGAQAELVAKVSAGKSHPKVKASEEDVKKVVAWMLSA